jgi:hypothetical protein
VCDLHVFDLGKNSPNIGGMSGQKSCIELGVWLCLLELDNLKFNLPAGRCDFDFTADFFAKQRFTDGAFITNAPIRWIGFE